MRKIGSMITSSKMISSRLDGFIAKKTHNLLVKFFLTIASYVFQSAVFLRNKSYDLGLFPIRKSPLPVVSIGNIIAGGSGKTPFTMRLCRDLEESIPCAILSRGYKGEISSSNSHSRINISMTPKQTGDEPYLLSKRLKHVGVYVGPSRLQSARLAKKDGFALALLDDGMQHRKIARDLEIVVLNGHNLFGNDAFLPKGRLRDFPSNLDRANYVVLHSVTDFDYQLSVEQIRKYTQAPIIRTCMGNLFIKDYKENAINIANQSVGAFCALGNPASFYQSLEQMCQGIMYKKNFSDHYFFEEKDIKKIIENTVVNGGKCVVCSEKDWIKIPKSVSCEIPIFYLEASLQVVSGMDHYKELIANSLLLTK